MKKSPPEVEHDVSKKRMNSLVSTAPHALNSSIDFQPNFHITDQVVEQNAEAEVKHMPSMISQAQWAPDSQIPFESVVESPPGLASPVLRPSRRQFVSRVSNAKDNSGLDANVPFQQGVLTPPTHAVGEQDAPSTWGLDVNVQFDDSAIIVDGVASPVLSQNGGVITSVSQSQANVASVARGSFKLDADVEFRPGVAVVQSRTARISRKPLPSLVDQHNTSSIIATHGQSQGQRAQGLATLDECTPIVPILEEFKVERKVDAYSPPARLYTDEDIAKRYEVLQASIAQVLIMTKWALVVSTVLFLLIFVPEVCSRASYWLISFFMILAPLQLFFGTWSLYDMTQRLNPRPVINGLLLQNSTRSAPSQQ
jgi:hypothetical protein